MENHLFALAIGVASRVLVWRDRLLGKVSRVQLHRSVRPLITSGGNRLDARLVRPEEGEARAVLLICHGIGETVEHWTMAQEMLASEGIASLVFNYSGFGQSTGWVSAGQCERDALEAYAWVRHSMPGVPVTLLGFSLGTGVAAAVVGKIEVEGLVLCEGYTSFREAACCAGLPGWMSGVFPDCWRTEDALRRCEVPVLVVHGEQDRLFPVAMGKRLAAAGGGRLVAVAGMGHADLHARPRAEDWQYVVDWVVMGTKNASRRR